MTASRRPAIRGEKGATLIIVALSAVALMAVAGLIIDGGRAYAERRQMQNASDSAAMAGARELDIIRTGLQQPTPSATDADDIYEAALAQAQQNGADPGTGFECYIVAEDGTYVTGSAATSACPQPDSNPTTPLPGGIAAAGVEVVARSTKETFLAQVMGNETFQARADATAQVQGLREVDSAVTPFMLCAFDRGVTPPEGPDILIPSGSEWATNPAAIWSPSGTDNTGNGLPGGPWYIIHGPNNEDVPGCDSGSQSFKGLVDDSDEFSLPGWWGSKPGNRSGPTRSILSDPSSCTNGDLDECILVVPMCVDGRGNGSNTELMCIRFGAFKIADTGNGGSGNRHHVAFLGDASVVVGEGAGGGAPALGELRVIKLTK